MADEPHAVVRLLLARMESHPEEFRFKEGGYHDRWYNPISAINSYGNEADKAAIAVKIRDIRMAEVHEQVMDELLNGEDRRRKEEEEAEYERKISTLAAKQQAQQQALTQQQMARQAGQSLQNAYANTFTNQLSVGAVGTDMYPTGNYGSITTSQLEPTLSKSAINQIKQALGIKK